MPLGASRANRGTWIGVVLGDAAMVEDVDTRTALIRMVPIVSGTSPAFPIPQEGPAPIRAEEKKKQLPTIRQAPTDMDAAMGVVVDARAAP